MANRSPAVDAELQKYRDLQDGLHHRTFRTFFSFVNCDRADVLVASAEHMLSTSKRKRYGQARAGAVETRRQGVQDDRTSSAEAGQSQPLLRKI
eukprot:8930-Heterococcus_DN1.PRE.1